MSENRGSERLIPVDHDPFAGSAEPAPRRGLIQNTDLDGLLPESGRVAGPWRPGTGTYPVRADYNDWLDMDKNEPQRGLWLTQPQREKLWNDAWEWVKSFSPEQREAVDKHFADNPDQFQLPSWEDEDRALKLPARARYWYELSSRGMAAEAPNANANHMNRMYNLVAGTSPSAEPEPNYRRALGSMAEHYQGLPIATDIISPGLVRKLAFAPEDPTAPKTGNFGGTFGFIGGFVPRPPLSTNDRQVAARYRIDPVFLAKTPWAYAGLSKFFQDYRDAQNLHDPLVRRGEDNPWETWQLQAPGWVDTRNQQEGWTGVERNDDYLHVQDRLKPELEAAGIDTSHGLLSHQVLSNTHLPDLMSTTRERYLASPVMTLETNTTMTPNGRRAADLFNSLPANEDAAFARNARADYEKIQRRTMRDLVSTGGGNRQSIIEKMVGAALGQKITMPRSDPRAWGTYGDTISPNLRIPMWAVPGGGDRFTLPDNVIRLILGGIGHAMYQEAVPASRFKTIEEGDPTAPKTYSVFLDEADKPQVPVEQLREFSRRMGTDAPLSVTRSPNGTVVDLHNLAELPPHELLPRIVDAANAAFPDHPIDVFGKDYLNHYMMHNETIDDPAVAADPTKSYNAAHDTFWREEHAREIGPPPGTSARVRANYRDSRRRFGDYAQALTEARDLADRQDSQAGEWADTVEPKLARWRAQAERARIAAAGQTLAGLGSLAGALPAAPGQFTPTSTPTPAPPSPADRPPPYGLVPVEHDPFSAAQASG